MSINQVVVMCEIGVVPLQGFYSEAFSACTWHTRKVFSLREKIPLVVPVATRKFRSRSRPLLTDNGVNSEYHDAA